MYVINIFTEKLKEVSLAILPVTLIVTLLKFTPVPIDGILLGQFLIGALLVVIGLTFFLIGVDLGITPLGTLLGPAITKPGKIWIVVFAGIILGFFISFAEPGLMILANQIDGITSGAISNFQILIVVSVGIAIMMVVGFMRMLFNIPLYLLLMFFYFIVFLIGIVTPPEFIAISFDTSGATTGVLAVPFILALSLGITNRKKDSKASEKDSFGLVAITSVGAIISIMVLNLFTKTQSYSGILLSSSTEVSGFFYAFRQVILSSIKDSLVALLPLIFIFLLMNKISFKLNKREFRRISVGFIYALFGLCIFFIGVNGGFMRIGELIGRFLATIDQLHYLIGVGFVLGFVTILAEPAVYVLTHQIEDVTAGYVKRKSVLFSLSAGVGLAVALSMLRIIVPAIQLWHYLLPGYFIALTLTLIVPKLFVGIAFDAGGVATGPMTATFILAYTNGAADAHVNASLLIDGFGMIAMVALMPIITLEILGLIFKIKTRKKGGVSHG